MAEKYLLNGFVYASEKEFDQAKKEQEAIDYICANTNCEDNEVLYNLYTKLLDKGTLKTMVGYQFLWELRATILKRGIVEEDKIRNIPVRMAAEPVNSVIPKANQAGLAGDEKQLAKYRELYEKEKSGKTAMKIVIGFLAAAIAGMFLVAQVTPYSIFTNYENKIINQYETWQVQLEKREKAVEAKEKKLGIDPETETTDE